VGKGKKVLLGILTFWPVLYMFVFLAFVVAMMFSIQLMKDSAGPPALFLAILPLHILTMLDILGLMVYYIFDLFKRDMDSNRKLLLAIAIFVGNMLILPVYWYFYILKEQDPLAGPAKRGKRKYTST
jgi:hypothetical protein